MVMTGCKSIREHLNDFLDGTLSATQAGQVNAHLEACTACRAEFRALKATQELVRHVGTPDGKAAQQRALNRFRAVVNTEVPREPTRSWMTGPQVFSGMAALGATAVLLFCMLHRTPTVSVEETTAPLLVTAASADALPSASDLDQMTSLHALECLTMHNGNDELPEDALADATSRLRSTGSH